MLLDNRYFKNNKKNYDYLVKENLRDAQNFNGWLVNFAPTGNLNLKFETKLVDEEKLNYKDFWNYDFSKILKNDSLTECLQLRCSTPVNLLRNTWTEAEIFYLLNQAICDGNRRKVYKDEYIPLRNYPSGGAQYPIKLYLVSNKNIGFFKKNCSYEVHADLGIVTEVENTNFNFKDIFAISHFNKEISQETEELAFAIVMVMNLKHSFKKYKYYSRQLAVIESGHIAQNLQLVSTSIGKTSLPNGGILSDYTKNSIGLSDSKDDVVIYGVAF